MRFVFFVALLSIGLSAAVFSQEDKQPDKSFFDKIYLGGNLGLQFGNRTIIDISPLAGYKITDELSAGVGVVYQYYGFRYTDANNQLIKFNTSIYGGKLFGRYYFMENVFGHAEYEVLNLETFDLYSRINVTNILVGGGMLRHIGGRMYISLMGLWNLNQSAYSPYNNPILRGGIIFR